MNKQTHRQVAIEFISTMFDVSEVLDVEIDALTEVYERLSALSTERAQEVLGDIDFSDLLTDCERAMQRIEIADREAHLEYEMSKKADYNAR